MTSKFMGNFLSDSLLRLADVHYASSQGSEWMLLNEVFVSD